MRRKFGKDKQKNVKRNERKKGNKVFKKRNNLTKKNLEINKQMNKSNDIKKKK